MEDGRMARGNGPFTILALIAIFLVTFSFLPTSVMAQPGPQPNPTRVELTVSPEEGHVDPTTEEGATTFTGTVSVTTLPVVVTTINVTIDAGDWVNETNQQTLVVTGNRDATFSIKVYSPYNSTANEEQEVVVTIKWTTSLNEKGTATDTVIAIVDQVYGVNVYSATTYSALNPGQNIVIKIYVSNTGNGDDMFDLKATENTDLKSAGWTFTLSKTSLELEADKNEMVQLTVQLPSNAVPGLNKFKVNSTSQGSVDAGLELSDDVMITIKVKDTSNGGDGNGTDDNKTKPWWTCSTELVPVLILVPLGATFYGVRATRNRGKFDE